MQVFFDDRQFGHAPEFYFRLGVNIPHPEQSGRARLLREIMIEVGHDIITPVNFGLDPIYAVHDPGYVDFFRTAYDRWVEGTGYTHPAIPNYHKGRRHLTIRWPLCSSDLILQRANPERRRFSGARPYVRE